MRPKSSRESKRSVSKPRATGSSSSNDASSSTSASGLEEGRPSSRSSTRSSHSASLSEHSYLTPEDLINELDGLQISSSSSSLSDPNNPRSFPHSVKQQCWDKADTIKGRDPNRWRRDPLGNIVFRKLVGCPGCLCHDYDHIVPYSKGGKSILENCQVLQAVTWISLSYQHMAMYIRHLVLVDATFSDLFSSVFYVEKIRNTEGRKMCLQLLPGVRTNPTTRGTKSLALLGMEYISGGSTK